MDPEPTDAMIEARLASSAPDAWDELWNAVDELAEETVHSTLAGGEQIDTTIVDGLERPVIQMPYVIYSSAVNRVLTCLRTLDLIMPFNWPAWSGCDRYRAGYGMSQAPVADAVRMITAVVRADRFSDGTIAAMIDDGTLPAALQRLRRWYREERPSQ